MISVDALTASVTCFVIGFFFGALVFMFGNDTVKRWVELRHEFRLKVLASRDRERERWLEVDAARPRPGDYRVETREPNRG